MIHACLVLLLEICPCLLEMLTLFSENSHSEASVS